MNPQLEELLRQSKPIFDTLNNKLNTLIEEYRSNSTLDFQIECECKMRDLITNGISDYAKIILKSKYEIHLVKRSLEYFLEDAYRIESNFQSDIGLSI